MDKLIWIVAVLGLAFVALQLIGVAYGGWMDLEEERLRDRLDR